MSMTLLLHHKFDLTMFDDSETIEDYGGAPHHAQREVKDSEIIMKMLWSLLPRFKQITIAIKTLLNVSNMSVADLTGWLKLVEEAFEEASTSLQQDGKLYLTKEEWNAWTKKHEGQNHSAGGAGKGSRSGHDCGWGSSSSGGSLNKPIGDECRHHGKMDHWARECRSKPKKEHTHVVEDK
jgi:hypothetical protein